MLLRERVVHNLMPDLHLDLFERLKRCKLYCICCSTIGDVSNPAAEEDGHRVDRSVSGEDVSVHSNTDSVDSA